MIASRAGRAIDVVAVSARDRGRDRGLDLTGIDWHDDAMEIAGRDDVDVVAELIGGSEGIAKNLVETALSAKIGVVTANKALLAHHGTALARMAEGGGVALGYEAAVAGGIPIIKSMREGLAGNNVSRVYGILNGTCNYILTTMRETGRSFDDVLSEAQELGYAEADPSFDVDGVDAAHKLAILAAIAFGREVDFDNLHIEGIRHVTALDIAFSEELGFRIKLLGIAEQAGEGVHQRIHPAMVSLSVPISQVEGVFNAVAAEGDSVGNTLSVGRGAGAGPTASAVIADIIDIGAGRTAPVFATPVGDLKPARTESISSRAGRYYLRLMVIDKPGVLAGVTKIFSEESVSVEAILQRGRDPGEVVPVVLVTHDTDDAAMQRSLKRIGAMEQVVEEPRMIRIEDF
jgi:homoserine dehydrogenase